MFACQSIADGLESRAEVTVCLTCTAQGLMEETDHGGSGSETRNGERTMNLWLSVVEKKPFYKIKEALFNNTH